ncbi:APC family permease [Enterococcus sp. LJL99]
MATTNQTVTSNGAGDSNKNKLSFISIYFLGINAIVGSGAFLLPQEIYKDMGVMSVVVLLCAAITVSMIALCYADLSSRFSGSGAAWLYSYNAFGKFTGFQIGLFSWFLGCLTLSAESVALLRTLKNIFPVLGSNTVKILFPACLIILLAVINMFGTSLVKLINSVSSAFKIFIIVFFIVLGAFFIKSTNFSPIVPSTVTDTHSFMSHFGSAFSVVFYMFSGFSFIPVAAAQMKNPEKNIPKALIYVMISVTVLYTLVQVVAIGILGTTIVKYDVPIAEAMKIGVGQWAYAIIILGMLISIFGVAFAVSFSTPALAASLAEEHNLLPASIGKKNKYGAPFIAVIVTSIISIVMTQFSYIFLVSCIVLVSFIQYVPSILAVIKFKKTKQFPNNGFSLKGGYLVPILALAISMYLLTNFKLNVVLVMAVVFALGVIVYFAKIKNNEG